MSTIQNITDDGFLKAIREFFEANKISQKQIAEKLGVTQPTISALLTGKKNFGSKSASEWCDAFGFSANFLLYKKPPVFEEGREPVNMIIPDEIADIATFERMTQSRAISAPTRNALPCISETPTKSYTRGVPYYNVDFIGGFDVVLNDQTATPEYLIDFRLYSEATCWCNITGHSMEPEINSGDIIAIKRVEDFSFLTTGEVYAIVTRNGLRTVKRLGPGTTPGAYTLISTNKAPEYGPQELPKEMILAVFQVLGCVKKF